MVRKFIDKKKSATFQLVASDGSVNGAGSCSDRALVRVDRNPYEVRGLDDGPGSNPYSALEKSGPENVPGIDDDGVISKDVGDKPISSSSLPDHIRREILELGFPDDGYNYLSHLKDIRNTGAGSIFHHNRKARLQHLNLDVKVYDSSKVDIREVQKDGDSILSVSEKTFGIQSTKALDPEVASFLNDDCVLLGSEMSDLEEDFVLQANFPDEEREDFSLQADLPPEEKEDHGDAPTGSLPGMVFEERSAIQDRFWRPLDEQFEQIEHGEYGTDDDEEIDSLYFHECSEREQMSRETVDDVEELAPPADVIERCREYAEAYENVGESSESDDDDSEGNSDGQWDCETVISTYSNLDNHPRKIESPERRRRNCPESLPRKVDPLHMRTFLKEKTKSPIEMNRKQVRPSETKEEKKQRKAAVKSERRVARCVKKEVKCLYRCEAQKAQRVVAAAVPASIRIL